MKRVKKLISSLLVAVIILTAAPLSGFVGLDIDFGWFDFSTKSSALSSSGSCGSNVTYTFDEDTGLLTISGTGAMWDYYHFDESPFYNNSSIISVIINNGVTSISDYAFHDCTGLTSITIPDSVTNIDSNTFSGCTGLTNITIPDSVTSIGSSAFSGCTGLTSVTIPDSISSIGTNAFYNCKNINYHGNATGSPWGARNVNGYIDDDVIYNDSSKSVIVSCSNEKEGIIDIPDSVIKISEYAFSGCSKLTGVIFPDSVTEISEYAFSGCSKLTNVIFSEGIKTIDYHAFNGCTGLETITIPESVEIIGTDAFSFCDNIKTVYYNAINALVNEARDYDGYPYLGSPFNQNVNNIVIGNSVKNIPAYLAKGCNEISEIDIPNGVEKIGSSAFSHCDNLKKVHIPSTLQILGCNSFGDCNKLEKIEYDAVNAVIETIDYQSHLMALWIQDSDNIKEIIFGNEVKCIPAEFLKGHTQVKNIIIPASVNKIDNDAFNRCENLETITFLGDGKIDFGTNVFAYCNKLKIVCKENSYIHNYAEANGLNYCIIDDSSNSFDLKNDILMGYNGNSKDLFISCASKIGFAAFENNQSVETIELASNVERIFNKAFANCSNLSKVIIPQSVASIGDNAFEGCDKLTIWCYAGSYAEAYAIGHGIPVRYITLQLNENELELKANESVNLCASFNTDLNDACEMIWTSEKPSVVSVTGDGKITAVGKGKATVTATSSTGLSATCVVNVVSDETQVKPKVNSVKIDDISLNYKKSKNINPQIDADEGAKYTVTYSSSNNKVATVDENGKVTATKRGSGSATITCTVTDEYGNTITDTCTVKVSLNFGQILLVYVLFGWIWY